MDKCHKCEHELSGHEKFCPGCGEAIAAKAVDHEKTKVDPALQKDVLHAIKEIGQKFESTTESQEKRIQEMERKLSKATSKVEHGAGVEWPTDKKERFLKFFLAVVTNDKSSLDKMEVKAMQGQADAAGGYLVPDEFRYDVIRIAGEDAVVRPRATVFPMTTDSVNLTSLATGVSISWTAENITIPDSDPTFGRPTLSVGNMKGLTYVPNELLEDATIDIVDFLTQLFAEAITEEEDRVALTGDVGGAGDPYDGLLVAANVTELAMPAGASSFADLEPDVLLDLTKQVARRKRRGAMYIMEDTILDVVKKLKDTTGNYIYQRPSDNGPGTIWGYPVAFSEQMPSISDDAADTPFIGFGNLNNIYIGDRKQMSVKTSSEAGFAENQTLVRVIQREGILVGPIANCLARLKTAV